MSGVGEYIDLEGSHYTRQNLFSLVEAVFPCSEAVRERLLLFESCWSHRLFDDEIWVEQSPRAML